MRDLHARRHRTIGAAHEAGIPIYAGTDAGGSIRHGRIADEIAELEVAGLTAHQALGAASWDARSWLGAQGIEEGAPADLVVYSEDPRGNPDVLAKPMRVILRGTPVSG